MLTSIWCFEEVEIWRTVWYKDAKGYKPGNLCEPDLGGGQGSYGSFSFNNVVGKFVEKWWICAVDRNGDEATNQSENGDFERLRGGVLDSGYGTANNSFRKVVIADSEVCFNRTLLYCVSWWFVMLNEFLNINLFVLPVFIGFIYLASVFLVLRLS